MDHRGEDNGRWEDAIQMHCGFSSPNQRLQKQFWLNLNVSIIRVDWSLGFTGCKLWKSYADKTNEEDFKSEKPSRNALMRVRYLPVQSQSELYKPIKKPITFKSRAHTSLTVNLSNRFVAAMATID